jgi:uncharacterized protein (DUF58 family)
LRRALKQTNRRHDLVAVHIEDPRERTLPDLGVLALEDAESGEVIEIDTGNAAIRRRFSEEASKRTQRLISDIRSEGVDTLELRTDAPYLPALQRFFKSRERKRI